MRNPLNKRFMREVKAEFGKYLVIFLFMSVVIGMISGFLVADGSLMQAYEESFEKYQIENGNFELSGKADEALLTALENEKVTIYDNTYVEEKTEEVDSTLRIFVAREEVNLACIMEGALPETDKEIAIDRMYADNNQLAVGDTITVGGRSLHICGLVALPDYSALFQNNYDMMFDAIRFGVAVMTQDGFAAFGDTHMHYSYSWRYDTQPVSDSEEKEMSDSFLRVLAENAVLTNFIPRYENQAIQFTGSDMDGDYAAMSMFLYIAIVIIAFIFVVTTGNTIHKEAAVIGTLRASGYKKWELVCHYMAMPMLVTLLAAVVGNILGYTFFKGVMADMYYGSYSLPTYVTIWNEDAFVDTTVIPLLIMVVIHLVILVYKLQLSPLKFLRHDLVRKPRAKAIPLKSSMGIFTRFRLRIIFQNMSNYVTLLIGILFANFLMLFGLLFPSLLSHYQQEITSSLISEYQYILKAPLETENADAEKFAMRSLNTTEGKDSSEEVTIYGVENHSAYLNLEFHGSEVYVSDGYAEKYSIQEGDTITLEDAYTSEPYDFLVEAVYEYPSAMAIFMDKEVYIETFALQEGYFNGYFSNEALENMEEAYIATIITIDDLTKVCRQLDLSIGQIFYLFTIVGTAMFILLMYLLSKLIIEKNAQSISLVKILGYENGEIGRLYILATTIVVLFSCIVTLPICNIIMKIYTEYMFRSLMPSGWLPYYVEKDIFLKVFLVGILCYGFVALMEMKRIQRISKVEALKNVEL